MEHQVKQETAVLTASERLAAAVLLGLNGIGLVAVALLGPLGLKLLSYATSPSGLYQLMGQDAANLLIGPVFIIGAVLFLKKRRSGERILAMSPLFLFYYGLSVGVGIEWNSTVYSGNSHLAFPLFLLFVISSIFLGVTAVGVFKNRTMRPLSRRFLLIYTIVFTIFLLMFAAMWLAEVKDVMQTGTSRGYGETPTAFWMIRYLDLGICIPLGFLSLYLLWTRPGSSAVVQMLFYGFFLTMALSVNAMGFVMFLKNDSHYRLAQQFVFLGLALLTITGAAAVTRENRSRAH